MTNTTKKLWLAAALVAVMSIASEVKAAFPNPTQALDIRVSINAQKSLEVGTTWYSFGALPISSTVVSGSSIAVVNDSGGLVETYTLQASSAVAIGGGGTDWVLNAAAGQDQYALGAQFAALTGADIELAFTSDALTYYPAACTAAVFGNTNAGESGLNVGPAGVRYLWFQIKTPTAVTDTKYHLATVTLAVQ